MSLHLKEENGAANALKYYTSLTSIEYMFVALGRLPPRNQKSKNGRDAHEGRGDGVPQQESEGHNQTDQGNGVSFTLEERSAQTDLP